jgi:hypothetical protein
MHNCIFAGHCTRLICDNSCPTYVESNYLLTRNGIQLSSSVFSQTKESLDRCKSILEAASSKNLITVPTSDTSELSNNLTYCAICQNWKGSQLHCTVYNLKFYRYLDLTKKSWSNSTDNTELEYMNIWAQSAKILIISNLDFVNFKTFECQSLLNLIQTRVSEGKKTIVISPKISSLVGSSESPFFSLLTNMLSKAVIKS